MKSTWLLVANGSEARLFETESYPKTLQLIASFEHQESREKGSELVTDRSGMYQGDTASGRSSLQGSMGEAADPREQEMERFAQELVEALENGRRTNTFKHLIIAASPRFHGLINKKMNDHLAKLVMKHINKDLTSVGERDLLPRVTDHIQ